MPTPTDPEMTVRVLLAAAGLEPTEDEIAGFAQAYPIMRAGADSLYIEEVRYEEPSPIFTPVSPEQ